MRAKEKAIELVSKFLTYSNQFYDNDTGDAKECALIAVDEIIKSNPSKEGMIIGGTQTRSLTINYWKEVKQEIKKL